MKKKKVITLIFVAITLVTIISLAFSFLLKNQDNNEKVNSSQSDIGEIVFYRTEMEHVATDPKGFMYVDNEILIVASTNASYSDIENLAKGVGAEIVGWIEQTGDYQLKLNQAYTVDQLNELVDSLNKNNFVDSAYINFASQIDSNKTEERNGFYFGDEWENDLQNFNNCKGDSWGIEAIEVLAAWDILDLYKRNVNPIKVGLIDSAFDTGHEDLGFAETFYNVDNGRDHGTHVAGTMAAKTDNHEGICGVYPYGNGNLYGVSYSGICNFSENGSPITTSMFLKIAYAELVLRDVKVINSSLGFNYYQWPLSYSDPEWDEQVAFLESNAYVLGDFLDRLLDKGYDFVLVNAAGNDSDRSNGIIYDSKYNFWTTVICAEEYPDVYDRIIVVGAVNSDYEICNFSNGGDRVDIFAPGDTIYSTIPNNNYANKNWSGTSMAAPHVSGVAAMVWSVNNDLTGAQVKEIVCGSHSFRCTSCNMVDAYVAMRAATHTDDTTDSTVPENGAILCWVVSADDSDIKIQNATVSVLNTQTGEEFSTTTDSMGHFEIFVPAGTYSLVVKAEGYEDFVWPNDKAPYTVPISVENGNVNYLDDWIKMQPVDISNNYESFTAVIESVQNSINYNSYSALQKEYCRGDFFEVDGKNALVLMYHVLNGTELTPGYYVGLWVENSDGTISCLTDQLIEEVGDPDDAYVTVNIRKIDGKMYLNPYVRKANGNTDISKNQYYLIGDEPVLEYNLYSEGNNYYLNQEQIDQSTFYSTQDKLNIRTYILGLDPNWSEGLPPQGYTFEELLAQLPAGTTSNDSGTNNSLTTELGLSADSAQAIVDVYVPFCQSLSDTYTSSDGSVATQRSCLVVEFETGSPNLVVHYWIPNAYDPGQFCEAWIIYGIESGEVVELYSDENYAPTRREIDMVYDDTYGFALREEQTGGYYELIIHYPDNVTDTSMYENYNYIQLSEDGHTLRVWTISGDYVDISF